MNKLIPFVFSMSLSALAGGIGMLLVPNPPFFAAWLICAGAAGLGWVVGQALLMFAERTQP